MKCTGYTLSQLRAMSYARTDHKRKVASEMVKQCKEQGFEAKTYKYPEVTIRNCRKLLRGW